MCVEKKTPDKLYGGCLEAAFSGIGAEQVEAFDDLLESLSARMREGIRYLQIALEATELPRRRPTHIRIQTMTNLIAEHSPTTRLQLAMFSIQKNFNHTLRQ